MATMTELIHWVAPPPPTSVVPDEAFEVGEPERIGAIDFAAGAIEINAGRETKPKPFRLASLRVDPNAVARWAAESPILSICTCLLCGRERATSQGARPAIDAL